MSTVQYIEGIDVSKHQGTIDWSAVEGDGYRFSIAKATEGRGYVDPKWEENAKGMEGTTMLWSGYHFARPSSTGGRSDGEAEAKDFARALRAAGYVESKRTLPPALDWEEYPDRPIASNLEWIEGFVHVIEGELGRSPMIYTGKNVWNYTTSNSGVWTHLPLWQVSYTAGAAPAKGLPWAKWTIWQWSGGGDANFAAKTDQPTVSGIQGAVDRNRYWGNEASLQALAIPTLWTPENPWNPDSEAHEGVSVPPPDTDVPSLNIDFRDMQRLYAELGSQLQASAEALHDAMATYQLLSAKIDSVGVKR